MVILRLNQEQQSINNLPLIMNMILPNAILKEDVKNKRYYFYHILQEAQITGPLICLGRLGLTRGYSRLNSHRWR